MNMKFTLLAIAGIVFSASALAAGDHYNPYVTPDEIVATPSMRTLADDRMVDHNNPYILSSEIVITKGCPDPGASLVADRFNPYVTFAQLEAAEKSRPC